MASDFEEAVQWVSQTSAPWIKSGQIRVDGLDPFNAIEKLRLGIYWQDAGGFFGGQTHAGGYVFSEEAAASLLRVCRESQTAFGLLSDLCVDQLNRNVPLTGSLRTFAILRLADELEKPIRPKAYDTILQNILLYTFARHVQREFGLKLTRGDAARASQSACDAVAIGLSKNGHHRTPESIKSICVGSTHRRARQVSAMWTDAYQFACSAGIIPAAILDEYWGHV